MARRSLTLPRSGIIWGALAVLAAGTSLAPPAAAQNRGVVEMITPSDYSSVQAARDLADILDDGATRRILPVIGRGAMQNLNDLRHLRGIDIGIVQTDVLAAARRTKGGTGALTYIAKLYNEELHVLARTAVHDLSDLAGKRVDFSASAAVTGPAVFDALKLKVEVVSDDPTTALQKLRKGQVAAIADLSGKPDSVFATLADRDLHFLAVPLKPEMASSYFPTQLTAKDYPNLVKPEAPVDTVSVGVVMIVAGLAPNTERYRNVANFVDAFFTQFPRLQEPGRSPKWNEVNLAAELPGWRRFPPAETWLQRNLVATAEPMSEKQLQDVFSKFIDERSRAAGSKLTSAEKNELFGQFLKWQQSQSP